MRSPCPQAILFDLHTGSGISFGEKAFWAHHLRSPRVCMGSRGGRQGEFQGKGAAPQGTASLLGK